METKFTKGEWNTCKYSPCDYGVYANSDIRKGDIALVRGDDEEAEANLKLIASAPELLKCCMDILQTMELNPTKENLDIRYKIERVIREAVL